MRLSYPLSDVDFQYPYYHTQNLISPKYVTLRRLHTLMLQNQNKWLSSTKNSLPFFLFFIFCLHVRQKKT